jgi:hypothetical protein
MHTVALPRVTPYHLVRVECSIKNDCMFATNWDISGWRLIDGVKRAISKAAHPTAYILSPGNDATLAQGENVSRVADAFRITPDWSVCRAQKFSRPTCLPRVAPQQNTRKLCPCRLQMHSATPIDASACLRVSRHDCASGTWGTACGNLTSHFEQAHAFETLIGAS